jgi:glycosyltransferase involved in cell wall biosynthesis
MATPERRVLHVLPHPGGGGEAYADALETMPGYRFARRFLATDPRPHASVVARSLAVQAAARSHDVLHVHGEVAATLCLPSLAARPSVVTLHGLNLLRRTGRARSLVTVNLRLIVRSAARTICVSRSEYDELIAATGPGAARRVVVIQNGVELPAPPTKAERAAARAEFGLQDASVVVVWVGALAEPKDPFTVVQAVREAARNGSRMTLLVAGDGPLRKDVERAGRDAPRGAVRVLGNRADVRRVLVAGDVFVLSSRREGLSYSLLEAMSIGLAPIVSDVPGNAEAVGDSGILVAPGDVHGFAAAFGRLAADENERAARGERARRRVAERFRAAEMIGRTRAVYEGVLAERQPRARPLATAQ